MTKSNITTWIGVLITVKTTDLAKGLLIRTRMSMRKKRMFGKKASGALEVS
jgi:hypothetical protein